MSLRLNLGVTVTNYAYGDRSRTTEDVARILERKYGVMSTFFQLYKGNIGAMLESSVAGALESRLMGAPVQLAPFEAGCSKIETLFRQAIDAEAFNGIITGVPTKAAQDGVRHSMKNPRKTGKGKRKFKRPPRASFFDTGLYSRNFKAWVDEQ